MPTLKEFIDKQPFTGYPDIDIIREWFCQNECEQLGIELISILNKSKIDKLEKQIKNAQLWIPRVPDVYISNDKKVPLEIADKLNQIIKIHLLELPLDGLLLDWAKKTIPTIDTPKIIFVPMVEWLATNYGIKFKDSHLYSYIK